MNRRGAEETTLSAAFIIKLILSAAILLAIFMLSVKLIALFTHDDESYRARRNMHLLADRVEVARDLGIASAEVVIDVPQGYALILFDADSTSTASGSAYSGIPRPKSCKEDACMCIVDATPVITSCRRIDADNIYFSGVFDKGFTLSPGIQNIRISFETSGGEDTVWLEEDAVLDCRKDAGDKVFTLCNAKRTVDGYYYGSYEESGGTKCYACSQLEKSKCDFESGEEFCQKEKLFRESQIKRGPYSGDVAISCGGQSLPSVGEYYCSKGNKLLCDLARAGSTQCRDVFEGASIRSGQFSFTDETIRPFSVGQEKYCGRCYAERDLENRGSTTCMATFVSSTGC